MKRVASLLGVHETHLYLQFKYQDDAQLARDVLWAFETPISVTYVSASSSMRVQCTDWRVVKAILEPWFEVRWWPSEQ